jgi:uncharacterized protein
MKLGDAPARQGGPRENRFEGAGRSQPQGRRGNDAPAPSAMASAFAKLRGR